MSIRIEETYYPNSILKFRCYYNDANQFHREDGPAYETYYSNGELQHSVWFLHGQIHREDGPSIEVFREDGTCQVRRWHINGKRHREDGPACEYLSPTGQCFKSLYYVNDERVGKPNYYRRIALLKLSQKPVTDCGVSL